RYQTRHVDHDRLRVIEADGLAAEDVWAAACDLFDLRKPVALVMTAVLEAMPDEFALVTAMDTYRRLLPPGSRLIISHLTGTDVPEHAATRLRTAVGHFAATRTPLVMRSVAEIERLFGGFTMCEPGVVPVTQWHPREADAATALVARTPWASCVVAGIGEKSGAQ